MSAVAPKPDLRRIGEGAFIEVVLVLLSMPVTVRNRSCRSRGSESPPVRSPGFSRSAGGAPDEAGTPNAQPPQSGEGDRIVSRVPLAGQQLSGSVQVQLPLGFVTLALRRLPGLEGTAQATDAVLDDAAGELTNMVAGRVAAQLAAEGFPCKLGTPAVVRGGPPPTIPRPGADHARTDFTCEGHALSVEVYCRYANP